MDKYSALPEQKLKQLRASLLKEHGEIKAGGLKLDMSRGKPNVDQLDFSRAILDAVDSKSSTVSEIGIECGNYSPLDGIPEAKRMMARLLQVEENEVFVGGNSSLNLMHDLAVFCLLFPLPGCSAPWGKQENVTFLCPVPGYDRHFAIAEHLGIKMVTVPMTGTGPDMDKVEELVQDSSVKGMWCIPKYSNPQGITYSDETVRRLAAMKPAAKDFRIFWDNAYAVHDLYTDKKDTLLPILPELRKHGNENNVFLFSSTSKLSFPGGGVAAIGASKENLSFINKHIFYQTIGYDKINQLRHARYFKDADSIARHMEKHASVIRPKFEIVLDTLLAELGGLEIAKWENPIGGYFICVETMPGIAKRVVSLCKEAGLVLTPAGATHPYGDDPEDKTIRIAPTFPNVEELKKAANLFCVCLKLAAAEKLLNK